MKQTATYWAPGPRDMTGNTSFRAPVTVLCRWQDATELFIDAQGREKTSSAIVYVPEPLALEGYLFLGVSAAANPKLVAGAKEIRNIAASPNLAQSIKLNKVWL
jgi:hypothetical protein